MRILAVRANPRKDGYTEYITDLLLAGIRRAGGEVDEIDLTKANIRHCLGCHRCWFATPGVCVQEDDMNGVLQRLLSADMLLCATPVYHYSMSSHLKVFVERTFPLCREGLETTPRGYFRNRSRYPNWKGKRLAFVAVGALKDPGNFVPLRETFELIAQGMNMELAGGIIRAESHVLGFSQAKPKIIKAVEMALAQAGKELALHGMISEDVRQKAEAPLITDPRVFDEYSAVYAEHATALARQGEAFCQERLQLLVGADVRILMREMVRHFDPVRAADVQAIIQFDFPDRDWHCRIEIHEGQCSISFDMIEACDLRVTVDASLWAEIATRRVNVREQLVQKNIHLEGDKRLFARLDSLFPLSRN